MVKQLGHLAATQDDPGSIPHSDIFFVIAVIV